MFRIITIFILMVTLTACQSNPLVYLDFDPEKNFNRLHYYRWSIPKLIYQPEDVRIKSDLTEQRITQAIEQTLQTKNMQPADSVHYADFIIKTYLIVENKQEQFTTTNYGLWGGFWGPYWGGAPAYTQTRVVEYTQATLQIDFVDALTEKLFWRGSTVKYSTDNLSMPEQREAVIQQAVEAILKQYPPVSGKK